MCSCLENPRDGGPGGLPSMGSHSRRRLKRLSSSSSTVEIRGFPGGSVSKESTHNAEELSSIPGSRRSPGEGNGNPFLYFLAWEIPWIEESGRLQSMGSQKSDMT